MLALVSSEKIRNTHGILIKVNYSIFILWNYTANRKIALLSIQRNNGNLFQERKSEEV